MKVFTFRGILNFLILITAADTLSAQPSDYWQQHVAYSIDAVLIDSLHSLDGKLSVVYTNNSPDTLKEVYFHLYNNAFRPGSMMHKRAQELKDHGLLSRFDAYESPADWGGYTISNVKNGGTAVQHSIHGTILSVRLSQPLPPRSMTTIQFDFFEQIPRQTRRNGWMNRDSIKYSMAQWYPKMCAYDREGWHNQEYISREFYGVYGEFDVRLTLPASYCVAATGQVQNPNEVGWGYERINRGEKKGKIYPKDYQRSGMLTWHFKAENVHDFAWVAHEYIHEWDTWSDSVTVHCLYTLSDDNAWKDAMKHTLFMLQHHSQKVGWYPYRNFYNTHSGDGGMEYPQLIMDMSPSAGLIAHEGGHQWFYGILGNNETRYAFLDEGFTEFIEMVCMESYFGRAQKMSDAPQPWLTRMFIPETDTRRNYYSPYLDLAVKGYEEPLYIPHDWAREGVNAGQVYFKTLNGLAQLEYVLGDSVFWKGMKEYYRRWKFKHPALPDFQRTMEDISGTKLDWYFDQWFHTTRTVDYAVRSVSSEQQDDGSYLTTVRLKNKDEAVMPIDLQFYYADGTTGSATIPLALNQGTGYQKPDSGRLFFPPWDWVSSRYKGSVVTPKKVSDVDIDPSMRLMDLNKIDNSTRSFGKFEWALWKQWNTYPPLNGLYGIFRPILWYEETSKLNAGIGLLLGNHRHFQSDLKIIAKTDPERLEKVYNTLSNKTEIGNTKPSLVDYIDWQYQWNANVPFLGRLTTFEGFISKMYGLAHTHLSLEKVLRPTYLYLGPTHTVSLNFDLTDRFVKPNYVYPVYDGNWSEGYVASVSGRYEFRSSDNRIRFSTGAELGQHYFRGSTDLFGFISNNFNSFSSFDALYIHSIQLPFSSNLTIRASGTSQLGDVPVERLYRLSSANPYRQEHSAFWKAVTSISSHFSREANFIIEGGAGVRGYKTMNDYGGMGLSGEITLPLFNSSMGTLLSSMTPSVFFDAGWIGSMLDWKDVKKNTYTSGGIGVTVDLVSWLPWQLQGVAKQYAEIPTIGFYFPVYQNHPTDGKEHFAFRYVISLGKSF